MKMLLVVILFLVLGADTVSAHGYENFEKGLKAYQAGVLNSTNLVTYSGE